MEVTKKSRIEIVALLLKRDGNKCAYPGCTETLVVPEGPNDLNPLAATIDHWMPQNALGQDGWTYEMIQDISNLRLMSKKCNARKGNAIPLPDGSLPQKKRKSLAQRRLDRAQRPEICTTCNSGRDLEYDETCYVCGSGPQPARFPAWGQLKTSECPHEGPYSCFACVLGIVERQPAIVDVLDGSILDD